MNKNVSAKFEKVLELKTIFSRANANVGPIWPSYMSTFEWESLWSNSNVFILLCL